MIRFRFTLDLIYRIFPDLSWQTVENEDRSVDIIGTDLSRMEKDDILMFVRVRDVENMTADGKWTYDMWDLHRTDGMRNRLLSDIVKDVKPDMTMEGYFGIMSKSFMDSVYGFGEMKPVVVAVVGESGSGKTSLSLELEKYDIPAVVSYTTRKMREGEVNGREHWFVDESDMPDKSDMMAYTFFGGNHYWTDIRDLEGKKVLTYVIDESGLLDLYELKKQGKIDLVYVYVKREDNPTEQERKDRDECRKEAQERLAKAGIRPHIVVTNDYPDAESFLKTDGESLGKTLRFITGIEEIEL